MAAELYLKPLARKFKRAVEKIQVDLNEHLQYGSIPKFADELFSVKLIPSNIHKKADFNDMMGNVASGMTVSSTLGDLEAHSCLFLEVLEKMDSKVCDRFATNLENSWISDAKSLNVSLTQIGKRYSTPSQVDDKQSDSFDYRKYFHDKQKSKYSKKKRKNISSDSLKAPQHQVMPRTEENGYLCSDTTESTTSENDASKRLWMMTPLQAQILSGSTSLPPTELVLLKRAAVTVITETPSHNRRTSLSHVFYSDGISGDAVSDALLLQPLIAGNAKNDLKLVSTGQHSSPIVSSSGQQACSPPQSKTIASARTQAAHDSITRGETTDQNGTYYRRRSSSIPDKFPSFPSNQSESKSDGINRTEIVAGGSSSRVSSLIANEQIMRDQFSCLELEEQSASRSTKLKSSNAHHCLSCEKLHEELHQKNTRIAVLEARLEEKITQIQAQNKIIEQLLSKNNRTSHLILIIIITPAYNMAAKLRLRFFSTNPRLYNFNYQRDYQGNTKKGGLRSGINDCPNKSCLCSNGIVIDYKNVQLLSQFVSSQTGMILPRTYTKICLKKQKEVANAIKRSRTMGFMPYTHKMQEYLNDPKIF